MFLHENLSEIELHPPSEPMSIPGDEVLQSYRSQAVESQQHTKGKMAGARTEQDTGMNDMVVWLWIISHHQTLYSFYFT